MSDGSELLGYIGGAGGVVAGVLTLVKFLGGRVMQNEEDSKKIMQAKIEKQESLERTTSESLIGIRHDIGNLRSEVGNISRQVEARATAQDKEITELRNEVKEQINQLEHRLRSDMQRLVSPPAPAPRRGRK